MCKSPYESALQYARKETRKCFKTSALKAQVHSQKKAWKRKDMSVSAGKGTILYLWKKNQIRKVSTLLLILILSHGTAI